MECYSSPGAALERMIRDAAIDSHAATWEPGHALRFFVHCAMGRRYARSVHRAVLLDSNVGCGRGSGHLVAHPYRGLDFRASRRAALRYFFPASRAPVDRL